MVYLRELERQDLVLLNQWRNAPDIKSAMGTPERYIALEVEYPWYDSYLKNRATCVRCMIISKETETPVGYIFLKDMDSVAKSAVLGIMIGEGQHRGKGYGEQAMRRMLEHGFYDYNLNRIELTVLEDNEAAIALYKKLGFVIEGVKRQNCYKKGTYKNTVMMSLLKNEYKQ